MPEGRCQEELTHVRGQGRSREDPMSEGRRPRGVTSSPRSGQQTRVPGCDSAGSAGRSYPTSKERWLQGRRRA